MFMLNLFWLQKLIFFHFNKKQETPKDELSLLFLLRLHLISWQEQPVFKFYILFMWKQIKH